LYTHATTLHSNYVKVAFFPFPSEEFSEQVIQ
jgi:hypothetical protein